MFYGIGARRRLLRNVQSGSVDLSLEFENLSDDELQFLANALVAKPHLCRGVGGTFSTPSSCSPDRGSRSAVVRFQLWELAKNNDRAITVSIPWYGDTKVLMRLGDDASLGPFCFAEYEPLEMYLCSQVIFPGAVCVDGGSSIGLYSLLFSSLVGSRGHVIAIDPNPTANQELRRTLQINAIRNVQLIECGLGSRPGTARLRIAEQKHLGHSTFGEFIYPDVALAETAEVAINRLDDLVESLGLDRCDFIKLDLEGAEVDAIEGATETLKRYRPNLLIEVNQDALGAQHRSLTQAHAVLDELNYRWFWVNRQLGMMTMSGEQQHYAFLRPRER